MLNPEAFTAIFAFVLTLLVFSYLLGDNPLFRLAVYLFVGISAGYAAAVVWHQVLWPRLFQPLLSGHTLGDRLMAVVPLVLSLFLLGRLSPRTARLGNLPLAFLVGIGAAVAVGGAVTGTLLPQVQASINLLDWRQAEYPLERLSEGVIILVGMITTLAYFHYGASPTPTGPRRARLVEALAWVGQFFLAVALGVLFAGALTAAATALVERLYFLWTFLTQSL